MKSATFFDLHTVGDHLRGTNGLILSARDHPDPQNNPVAGASVNLVNTARSFSRSQRRR